MAKVDVSGYKNFEDITARLDEIVGDVRDKGTSLERSLDLFDEAIALGSKAVEMVDKVDFSEKERELLEKGATPEPEGADAQGAADGEGNTDGEGAAAGAEDAAAEDPAVSDEDASAGDSDEGSN